MLRDSWGVSDHGPGDSVGNAYTTREGRGQGVATALRALIDGKALSCTRHHPEKLNGFELWRLLYREYKPDTATRKVGLLERVMDDQPAPGMDFGDLFLRWLDLVGECEKARGRMIDDDIKWR